MVWRGLPSYYILTWQIKRALVTYPLYKGIRCHHGQGSLPFRDLIQTQLSPKGLTSKWHLTLTLQVVIRASLWSLRRCKYSVHNTAQHRSPAWLGLSNKTLSFFLPLSLMTWTSQEAQWGRKYLQCSKHGFSPWVRKIPWRWKWQPTPVFLPGKFHRQRSLVGYSPWDRKESDTSELTNTFP